MKVWMYYETDGDSGFYSIKLFSTEKKAREYAKKKNDSYGNIGELTVE